MFYIPAVDNSLNSLEISLSPPSPYCVHPPNPVSNYKTSEPLGSTSWDADIPQHKKSKRHRGLVQYKGKYFLNFYDNYIDT